MYYRKSVDDIFIKNKKGEIHESIVFIINGIGNKYKSLCNVWD
jgi:hypothetical protein